MLIGLLPCATVFLLSICCARAGTWNIVWSDEFNGTAIDPIKWTFETGNNNGWGNNELEYYTARPQNAFVSGGFLHIVAQKESYYGSSYTSARLKTQNLFTKEYGRFEFRAKLPAGLGFWPAFWLLGADISSAGWPACGEIDVMENQGSNPARVQGTLHYSDASNQHLQATAFYNFPANNGATNFHNYLLEWAPQAIKWYVDGQLYQTQTSWSSSTGPYPAPFNQPFFLLMNLAIGGSYLGNPSTNTINANTVFPGTMLVDYVRVYDLTAPLRIDVIKTNATCQLSWPSEIVCRLQSQSNSAGLTTNWFDVPDASNPFPLPASIASSAVFYRLISP